MANKITWNDNQVSKLQAAVRKYNEAVKRMQSSGNYEYAPFTTSFQLEKSRIQNRWQLRTRIKQLERAIKLDSFDIVEMEGHLVPRYLKNEINFVRRAVNNKRQAFRVRFFPEDLTNMEYYEAFSNKNIYDLNDEGYMTGEDLEDLISELYPDIHGRVNLYLGLLQDNMEGYDGYDDIMWIIQQMAEKNPDKLEELWNSNFLEVDIGYIYPENAAASINGRQRSFKVEGKTYYYRKESAFKDSESVRYDNIKNFWYNVGNTYLGTDYTVKNEIDLRNITYKPRNDKK